MFSDWLTITTPLTYPIRVDTENSPRLHAQVFRRLAPALSTFLEQAVDGKHYSLTFCDWLKSVTPLSYPIKIETENNRHLHAQVFPRLEPTSYTRFEF